MQIHKHLKIILLSALVMTGIIAGVAYAQDGDSGDIPIVTATVEPVRATSTPALLPTLEPSPTLASGIIEIGSPTPTVTVAATGTAVAPLPVVTSAVTITATPEPLRAIVDVESAFIRAAPSFEADLAASAFRDESLEVIGRNLDGTWFEVQRPFRNRSLGWISISVIDYEFEPEYLPLTDIATGVEGDNPLTVALPFAVWINEGVALRTLPDVQRGERILNIPPSVVVPVRAQWNQGEWLLVNYLGTEGWIIAFTTRERDDVTSLPRITGLLPGDDLDAARTFVVPPEIQMAELERMRAYAEQQLTLATDLENFWWLVSQYEVLPCDIPPSVANYAYGAAEVRILPEIDRYAPRFNEGVARINSSIDILDECGVIDPRDVSEARSDAINARIIIENTLVQLDNLEEIVDFSQGLSNLRNQ